MTRSVRSLPAVAAGAAVAAAAAASAVFLADACFVALPVKVVPTSSVEATPLLGAGSSTPALSGLQATAAGLALGLVAMTARPRRGARRSGRQQMRAHGEDLSVPGDAFVVLGLAHCFEQVEGKLKDCWVLEPVSASTVEVIENGAHTSYEAFIGTTVSQVLAKDVSAFPAALLCGHQVQWGEQLEFRTGCSARTWMRDHAREVVRKLVPLGQVKTGFNTNFDHKRILNFVHEVKDSDNIKQDMSIDVYGRKEEEKESEIASLYNA